ncbi:MAG: protein-disulfide reductase DsbD domain-containing protein, partial [Opitutaceae bacterium]
MMLRRLPIVLFCTLSLLAGARAFGAVAMPSYVKASLVAADSAVQPGKPLTVALRLVHDPRWHTYWVNPGIGLATSIEWKLPPGWKAGEIQWPAPKVLKDSKGTIVGNGYEGELFLPVTLTPPAGLKPGEVVELKAAAEWLMCEDVCIPGNAGVALTIPVSTDAAKPDPAFGEKIRATIAGLPRADPAWKVSAARNAKTVALTITPAQPGAQTPKDVHFFSQDGLIAYDLPQAVKPDGRGGVVLTLQVAADAPPDITKLIGVATSENGWVPDGTLRGLTVAAEFSGTPAAGSVAAASGSAGPTTGAATAGAAAGSLPGTLLLAFVGGLILNLMPCVFPVLGIKILGFVNQAGHERSKIVGHGIVFTLGVLISFWALAGALAILRAGGDQLGWGFQLQSPAFVYALAVLLLVFAMNMSGVFEFGLSATAVGSSLQTKSGYAGSFFTGILATVVATPCSAPFLAPA